MADYFEEVVEDGGRDVGAGRQVQDGGQPAPALLRSVRMRHCT